MYVVYFFCRKTASSIGTTYWIVCVCIIICIYICVRVRVYPCVCVDFGAGWLWFIRSPLKNRCGKGNEMHKKRCMCVLCVSDHGFFFFFFTIHYPRLCACVGAWVKKKHAFEPVVLLLFLVYARVASWFIACRGFTRIRTIRAATHFLLLYANLFDGER
jgi:hypothetical protein